MHKKHIGFLLFIAIVLIYAVLVSIGCLEPSSVMIVAISIASWFLALGDFCVSQSSVLQEEVFMQLSATEAASQKIVRIGELAIDRQKQVILNMGEDDQLEYYAELEANLRVQEREIANKNKQLQNAAKGNNRNKKIGKALRNFGYVTFILIIVFARDIDAENSGLDILTVWAFFIMLLGYFMGSLLLNQKDRQRKESEDALSALDTMEAELEAEVIHNAN